MKRRHTLLLAAFLILVSTTYSQGVQFDWANQFGLEGSDQGHSIASDGNGTSYTVGSYSNAHVQSTPAGPIIISDTFGIFICRYDPAGTVLWTKHIINAQVYGTKSVIAIDSENNIYVLGTITSADTVDLDPGVGSFPMILQSTGDIFLLKLDQAGDFQWAKTFTSNSMIVSYGNTRGSGIALDSLDHIYVTGDFLGTVDFDPGNGIYEVQSTAPAIFLLQLDSDGAFVWLKQIDGDYVTVGGDLVIRDGIICLNGLFMGSLYYEVDGVPLSLTATGNYLNTFLLRSDLEGNIEWIRGLGDNIYGNCVSLNESGNAGIGGYFANTADFDPGPGIAEATATAGFFSAFVAEYDPNGDLVWANTFSGDGNSAVNDIGSGDGFFYATGDYDSVLHLNVLQGYQDLTSNGASDLFLVKIDQNGLLFAKAIGGEGPETGNALSLDSAENIYLAGSFWSSMDADPGSNYSFISPAGNVLPDALLMRFNTCTFTYGTDVVDTAGSYTWINGVTYVSNNFTDTYVLENVAGCDSILTLHLTLADAGMETISVFPCTFFPNPSEGMTSFQVSEPGVLTLHDAQGKLVWTAYLLPGITTKNLQPLAAGVYTVGFETTAGAGYRRLIRSASE
jgi:hypothetical protein